MSVCPPPRVLVVATVHWATTTRLCLALAEGGFEVAALVPDGHGLLEFPGIAGQRLGRTRAQALRKIRTTIERAAPDLLVSADDPAIGLARLLYGRALRGLGRDPRRIADLIEASAGMPSAFTFAHEKSRFIELAATQGLPVPRTIVIGAIDELRARLVAARFPVVLKRDQSFGGRGVRLARDGAEAERAFLELQATGGRLAALKQALRKRDPAPLERFYRQGPAITLQEYITGRPANRAVTCHRGTVLAGLSVEALRTNGPFGPATVVRLTDSQGMTDAAARMVRRLGLSGFVGFDFVLEERTGRPFLIEMNGRPTQICHLALDKTSDMIGALAASVGAVPRPRLLPNIEAPTVALFPQEVWRDPTSEFLRSAHHDVPWASPDFVERYRKAVPPEPPDWVQASCERLRRAGRAVWIRRGARPLPGPASLLGGAEPPPAV